MGTLGLENACSEKAVIEQSAESFGRPPAIAFNIHFFAGSVFGKAISHAILMKNIFYSSFSNCFCGDGPGFLSVIDELTSTQKRCPR